MSDSVNENLGLALRTLLKPLAKLLIDQGITHKGFSEAAKEAFVEMALRQQYETGRINRSRVAIVTGLTRKEVAKVIDRAMRQENSGRNFSRPGKVLHGWHNDPAYSGPYGVPLEISYDGIDGSGGAPSFVHLVRVYSGDQSPLQMLDELKRVSAVKELDDGSLRVLRPDFEPDSLSPKLIERFGDVAFNLLTTLSANVQKTAVGQGVFDRVVISDQPLNKAELEEFDVYLKSRGQDILVEIDNWLTRTVSKKKGAGLDSEANFDSGVAMLQYITLKPEEKSSLRDFLIENNIVGDDEKN